MEIFTSETRVFFSKICMLYGVEQLTKGMVLDGEQLYKWQQVLIYKGKTVASFSREAKKAGCYTPYKGVAERWASQVRQTGVV